MELLQLRYFAAAAKHQNITKAAREFLIPQPAMSKTISRLEKELGTPLFERTGNRVVLNESGVRFYAAVRQMLDALDNGISALQKPKLGPEIKLLILQNRNAVIDLIADFVKLYPHVRFTIYHGGAYPKDFEFDFCLASENFHRENTQKLLLFTEDILLALPNSHPLARKSRVSLDDLREEPFVSMPENAELSLAIQKACQKHNFKPHNVVICDDPFYVRKYVSLGMGAAFAPTVAWAGLWPDNVVLIPVENMSFQRSTYLYFSAAKEPFDERQIFKDYLLSRMESF